MMKQLVFLLAVAMATLAMAEDAGQPTELTEEQLKEAVFELSKELAVEVEGAVETINEIFGNPACENNEPTKRGTLDVRRHLEDKRSWSHFWAGTAAGLAAGALILGKREGLETRAPVALSRSINKRGWGSFRDHLIKGAGAAAGAAAVGALLGKRGIDESPQAELEYVADVTKLRHALDVLNAVLIVAENSVDRPTR